MVDYKRYLFRENTEDELFNARSKIANKILRKIGVGIFSEELFNEVYLILFREHNHGHTHKEEAYKELKQIFEIYDVFSRKFLDNLFGDFRDFLFNYNKN